MVLTLSTIVYTDFVTNLRIYNCTLSVNGNNYHFECLFYSAEKHFTNKLSSRLKYRYFMGKKIKRIQCMVNTLFKRVTFDIQFIFLRQNILEK